MPTKPLDRLMFAQGGLCFFCSAVLPKAVASVEHLVATSRAGSNSDDNCVACCKAMNGLLGSMSLKEKIKVVLNQKGQFKCPNGTGTQPTKSDAKPLAAPQVKPQPKPQAKPQAKPQPKPQAKPQAEPQPKPKLQAKTEPIVIPKKVPALAASPKSIPDNEVSPEKIIKVIERLRTKTIEHLPDLASLKAAIAALNSPRVSTAQLDFIVKQLESAGKISIQNETVSYKF